MKKSQSSVIRRRRKRMFDKNPNCPQCGVLMILPETLPRDEKGRVKVWPLNTCTYEHGRSRLDPLRKKEEPFRNKIRCLKCNNMNGENDVKKFLTLDEIRDRSKRHPARK